MTHLTNNLLALGTAGKIGIGVGAGLAALALVYGFIKKFSRMSWAGYQIAILFAASLLLPRITFPDTVMGFVTLVGGVFGAAALVMVPGLLIRGLMRGRRKRAHGFIRFIDRILGVLTALFDLAVLACVLGGLALCIVESMVPSFAGNLSALYDHALWATWGAKLPDLFLIALLVYSIKGGYRLGLARSLWVMLGVVLGFGSVFGALYLTLKVPFLKNFAWTITKGFSMNILIAKTIGIAIVTFIVFLVMLACVVLLMVLMNLLFKQVNKIRILNFISSAVLAVIFYAFCVAFVSGVNFGLQVLSDHASVELLSVVSDYVDAFIGMLDSAPLCGLFYRLNPLLLLGV